MRIHNLVVEQKLENDVYHSKAQLYYIEVGFDVSGGLRRYVPMFWMTLVNIKTAVYWYS